MPFLAVGVEHSTAPLVIREQVALDRSGCEHLSAALLADPAIAEIAILSTCNRTELYLVTETPDGAAAAAAAALDASRTLTDYVRRWDEREAVEHLFRVASGLASQVLGEPQVLSQVREALEMAQELGTIGPNLHALFRSAISCARQARAGTVLGRVNLSVGTEAVHTAASALGGLQGRKVLVVGGGEIARRVAEELKHHQATLWIANRTPSVAVDLASRVGGRPAALSDIPRLLPHVDLVLTATAARHYIFAVEDIPARDDVLHIFDLAIPRDVDPAVAALSGVALHDLDSLLPPEVTEQWETDIRGMEAIIAAEVQEFMSWTLTRRVVPIIANLRSHVEAVSRQELKRVAPQLSDLTERERAAVESLTQRLIDKMFHHLVTRLRLAAQTDSDLVDAAAFFFLHGEGGLFEHAANSAVESEPELKT